MLTPWHILAIALLILLLAWFLDRAVTRNRSERMRALALKFHMRYVPVDRFHIAPRIAIDIPVPGAADVRVRDLMYRTDDTAYTYVFSVEYATGTIDGVRRNCVVARAVEPAGRSCDRFTGVRFSDTPKRSLTEQYEALMSIA